MILSKMKDSNNFLQFSKTVVDNSTPKVTRKITESGGPSRIQNETRRRVLTYLTSKSKTVMLIEALGALGMFV